MTFSSIWLIPAYAVYLYFQQEGTPMERFTKISSAKALLPKTLSKDANRVNIRTSQDISFKTSVNATALWELQCLIKHFHKEWLKLHINICYHISKPLVATVARNCLFYSLSKARIMVDKFRIHLNTFRLKLSEHTDFCIDNQHCCHNCHKYLLLNTVITNIHNALQSAVVTTAPLPNFCVHSYINIFILILRIYN